MFLAAENSSPPARKSGRSSSPTAIQKRRLQNRLAQRNHRYKVREQNRHSGERGDGSLDKTATSQDTTRPSRDNRQRKSVECESSTTAGPSSSQSPSPSLLIALPSTMMNDPPTSEYQDFWVEAS